MAFSKRFTPRSWPLVAVVLVSAFIVYGLLLISRSRQLQEKIAQEIHLLDDLSRLSGTLGHLSLTHRMDVGTKQYQWPEELSNARATIQHLASRYKTSPGMHELPGTLNQFLQQADSVHANAMVEQGSWSEQRPNEVVFDFIMQRAQSAIDRTTRQVHEQGLGKYTTTLSDRWNEAQFLLLSACLFAVVFAWLVGVSHRLLLESRSRSEQLNIAKHNLERANKELRETMLSKEEKEVMIKEIHHRVKNNLQVVDSLLHIQGIEMADPLVGKVLRETQGRIRSMALVHDQIYRSQGLGNGDLRTHLEKLSRNILVAYGAHDRISVRVDTDLPLFRMNTLLPLTLVVNELLTNALKYAFQGQETGRIAIAVKATAGGYELRCQDDGVGMAPDHARERSFGLELVRVLAEQLNGSFRVSSGNGTTLHLDFAPDKEPMRIAS